MPVFYKILTTILPTIQHFITKQNSGSMKLHCRVWYSIYFFLELWIFFYWKFPEDPWCRLWVVKEEMYIPIMMPTNIYDVSDYYVV